MSIHTSAPLTEPPHPLAQLDPESVRAYAANALARARTRSTALTDAVGDDELVRQHSQLMSPLVWDLAHIGNQEDQWLVRQVGGRNAVRGDIDELYDAFQHSRADRPSLPLLSPHEARTYARQVRAQALEVLDNTPLDGAALTEGAFAFGMITQHEQQHDETMLATHQLRRGEPALHAPDPPRSGIAPLPGEARVEGGPFLMGTSADPWALDNERPAHPVNVDSFYIDTAPVTNDEYRQFVEAGGYHDQRWWTAAGWEHLTAHGISHPRFWCRRDGEWRRSRFGYDEALPPDAPVLHVCWHEANAYAAWVGKRLPTEAEWEKAARFDPDTGQSRRFPWGETEPTPLHANLGGRHLQPASVGAYPSGESPHGVHQLIGDVWEWTSTDFHGYPGFTAFPYREYSEVFFGTGQKVLRGGSFGTDRAAIRGTFRNWDYMIRRQIFAGIRLARDVPQGEVS